MSDDAFVLDASVTATWLLRDEHAAASQALSARLRGGHGVPVPGVNLKGSP